MKELVAVGIKPSTAVIFAFVALIALTDKFTTLFVECVSCFDLSFEISEEIRVSYRKDKVNFERAYIYTAVSR